MALEQVEVNGKLYYIICPNCKHWDVARQDCKWSLTNLRKPFVNVLSCTKYDDSHTRPGNWEMGMG